MQNGEIGEYKFRNFSNEKLVDIDYFKEITVQYKFNQVPDEFEQEKINNVFEELKGKVEEFVFNCCESYDCYDINQLSICLNLAMDNFFFEFLGKHNLVLHDIKIE